MFDFTLVVVEGCLASGLTSALDMLAAAHSLAHYAEAPVPRWRVASLHGGWVHLHGGFGLETTRLSAGDEDRSTWIIPALDGRSEADLQRHLDGPDCRLLGPLLREHLARGGQVAACASAVLLLAPSGAMIGRRVTTSWWLADALRARCPAARVDTRRLLCVDGPVITCGPAFALPELMLHLISELSGPRLARELAMQWLHNGEADQGASEVLRRYEARDAMMARIVESVERRLPEAPRIGDLARELAMSERTLSRYVRRITGKSPSALVQDVKLRRARSLLERSRLSVDQVAAAVGYSDSTALRRLMKRATGVQPSHYRSPAMPA